MKKMKILSMAALAIATFMVGSQVKAEMPQKFLYDYEFNILMPENLTSGENTIIITANEKNKDVVAGDVQLRYVYTEVTKAKYEELKAAQEAVDEKRVEDTNKAGAYITLDDEDEALKKFNDIMNAKYNDKKLYCDETSLTGKIKVDLNFCGKKYVIVSVLATDAKVQTQAGQNWEYQIARAYELTGTKTSCEPSETPKTPENPKTGIANPYILCGTIALGAIAVIVVSKKKRFI